MAALGRHRHGLCWRGDGRLQPWSSLPVLLPLSLLLEDGQYPVSSVALVTVLTPLFSVVFSVLFLGDVLDARMIVGGVLTLAGVTVILVREQRGAARRT